MKHPTKKIFLVCIQFVFLQSVVANSISDGIVNKTVKKKEDVVWDPFTSTRGREYSAKGAEGSAGTGKAVAIAVGSSLMAAGQALLASPFPPNQVAGADLVAKAILEFLQAIQDKKSEDHNGAQKNLLQNAYANSQAPTKLDLPLQELRKLANDQGLDGDEFVKQVEAGEITTGDQVLQALGKEISSEDKEKGLAMASSKLDEILDAKGAGTPAPEPPKAPGSDLIYDAKNRNAASTAPHQDAALKSVEVKGAATISKRLKEEEEPTAKTSKSFEELMAGLLKTPPAPEAEAALTQLLSIGVKVSKSKLNIFQIARKTYRTFGVQKRGVQVVFKE